MTSTETTAVLTDEAGEMKRKYEEDRMSVRAICAEYGRPYTTVHYQLSKAGVTMRSRGGRNNKRSLLDEDDAKALKARENRSRSAARQRGLSLRKSPRKDPGAWGYGTYMLVDPDTNFIVHGDRTNGFGLSLDEIEYALG